MSGTLPTGGYPNWIDPSTGEHCYAKTGSKRLGHSPPPMCLCGHKFHFGPCAGEVCDMCRAAEARRRAETRARA